MVEFLFDTTRAVVNLALNGVLERYPAIRWVVPHAGAALPVLADRVSRLAPLISPPPDGGDAPDVLGSLGRLHYDLAGMPLPRALPALLNLVPPASSSTAATTRSPRPRPWPRWRRDRATDVLDKVTRAGRSATTPPPCSRAWPHPAAR